MAEICAPPAALSFQEMIAALDRFWGNYGCVILQPFDMEIGAGTFHPNTFLNAIGPEPWNVAHVQSSRRPADGRYGENPNRGQHFYQYQVLLKPSPENIQELYLQSLECIGIDPLRNDLRFVEDNWEGPTLGAWGLGWEVWCNGMEISQFTYFQQVGGLSCSPVSGEIAYGLERIAMKLQNKNNMYDLLWQKTPAGSIYYGDLFQAYEAEMSAYHFEHAPIPDLFQHFDHYEQQAQHLVEAKLPRAAYEYVLKASHTFNMLDARGAVSVTERQRFILRVRSLAKAVAESYFASRQALGFPLIKGSSL